MTDSNTTVPTYTSHVLAQVAGMADAASSRPLHAYVGARTWDSSAHTHTHAYLLTPAAAHPRLDTRTRPRRVTQHPLALRICDAQPREGHRGHDASAESTALVRTPLRNCRHACAAMSASPCSRHRPYVRQCSHLPRPIWARKHARVSRFCPRGRMDVRMVGNRPAYRSSHNVCLPFPVSTLCSSPQTHLLGAMVWPCWALRWCVSVASLALLAQIRFIDWIRRSARIQTHAWPPLHGRPLSSAGPSA